MKIIRDDRWLVQIEYQYLGEWFRAGTGHHLRRKPKFTDDLAAIAYTVIVSDWLRYPEGRRTYRLALYRVSRRGVRQLRGAISIPPAGWGVDDYHYVEWPTGVRRNLLY